MDPIVQHLPELALAGALAWGAGLRLYLVVFGLGLAAQMGWLPLPAHLEPLASPLAIGAAGFMALVELFADKLPWLDSLWDVLHSVIRVPGGAALAAGVFGADNATMAVVAGLLGGSLAATSLAGKATTRAAVNTSPEPFSNVAVSLLEDGLVVGALWLAVQHPLLFAGALVVTLVFTVLLIVALFKFLRAIGRRLATWFKPSPAF